MLKVLFLCTENSCRSQMAEGLVNHDLDGLVKAFSAGIQPNRVHPRAIQVMPNWASISAGSMPSRWMTWPGRSSTW